MIDPRSDEAISAAMRITDELVDIFSQPPPKVTQWDRWCWRHGHATQRVRELLDD